MIDQEMQPVDETSFEQALKAFKGPVRPVSGETMKVQDETTSFFSASDVIMSVPRGVVGAAKGVYNLADLVTFDLLPDWDKNPLGASTSTVGGFLEVLSEFAVGFATGSAAISAASKASKLGKVAQAAKWMQGTTKLQKFTKATTAGGFADFAVFEGDEMRLSNLVESIPALSNPITEFLAAKEDDVDSLTGRLKNLIEGGIVGTALEGAVRGVSTAYRTARGIAAAAEVVKETRRAAQAGMSAAEVFEVREQALRRNKKWLEDVPAASEEYLAEAERRFVQDDPIASEIKAEQPGSEKMLQRILLDSARKKQRQGMPREAARVVESFIERVGTVLFDGTTFSVRKLGEAARGTYDFADDILTVSRKAYEDTIDADSTFLHEAWHMLSRYLDDPVVRKLNDSYHKEVDAFIARTGIDPRKIASGSKPGIDQSAKDLSTNLSKAAKSAKVDFYEFYSLSSFDEWFVYSMVRETTKLAEREARTGVFGAVRNVIDALVDSFRGDGDLTKVAQRFLSGDMQNRAHRNLLMTYRRSLKDRVIEPSSSQSFNGEDVVFSLAPDAVSRLGKEIPRNADGTIDAQRLREFVETLREEDRINLMPLLNDRGEEEAALAIDAMLKSGGIPEPRPTMSRQAQIDAAKGALDEVPTKPTAIETAIDKMFVDATARNAYLQGELDRVLGEFKQAIQAGDTTKAEAAAALFRVYQNIYDKSGTATGRLLEQRRTRDLARMAFDRPEDAEVAAALLDGIPNVVVTGPRNSIGKFTDSLVKFARTGLDVSLELFRNSILSGPRTVVSLTTIGNLSGMFVTQGERAYGGWIAAKILGRRVAKDMDALATREGRVMLGYLDQVFDALGMLVGRTPKGGMDAAGRPLAISNAIESWRREGMGVTLGDRAWSEGVEPPRGIDAQRFGLGSVGGKVDEMGRQVFEPSPFGHVVNFLGKVVNIPMRTMGALDEAFSTSIARTNARMYAERQLGKQAAKMTSQEIDRHVDGVMKNLFDETGRIYSRKAVEERAIKQVVREGIDPNSTQGKSRVLALVLNGDAGIGFQKYDAGINHLARQIESRIREATWKKDLDDLINDPLRGFGTALVGNLGKSAQSLVRNVPAAGLVLPFIRTPTNLIAWALNRNPASLLWKGIQSDWYRADPQMQAELVGRLTTGVAIYSAGVTLATMGVITGKGPRDPAMRQQLRESGWQPYSIKVGDTYVSYARADPFSTILGFVADLADAAHKVEEGEIDNLTDVAASMVGVMTSVITDKTFIAGLTGMLNAITRPDLYGEQLVKQYAAAFVPNFFAQTLTPFSDELERSRSALDAVMSRVPGWGDDMVDKVRNPLGEPLLREKGPLGNITDPINPFSITTAKNDPLNQEFIRLGRAISNPRRTLPGGIDLWDFRNSKGQTAYDRYQELTSEVRVGGRNLRSALMSLIGNRQYQGLPDSDVEGIESPRGGILKSEIGRYRKRAFDQLLREFPELRSRINEVNQTRAGMR